jgi:hypothetical protein
MVVKFACRSCRRPMQAAEKFAGKRGECPFCGCVVEVPQMADEAVAAELAEPAPSGVRTPIQHYFEPPSDATTGEASSTSTLLRLMFESLLDPRSIQWMFTLGGGLSISCPWVGSSRWRRVSTWRSVARCSSLWEWH